MSSRVDKGSTLGDMKKLQEGMEQNLPATPGIEVAGLSAETAHAFAQTFSCLAGDVALVIDRSGLILGAARGEVAVRKGLLQGWEGLAWIEAVATDSREKVAAMLLELAAQGWARRREINFQADGEHALALACSGLRLGTQGISLVVGRDLHVTASLQQQLLQAQQQLEKGYWSARRRLVKGDAF